MLVPAYLTKKDYPVSKMKITMDSAGRLLLLAVALAIIGYVLAAIGVLLFDIGMLILGAIFIFTWGMSGVLATAAILMGVGQAISERRFSLWFPFAGLVCC